MCGSVDVLGRTHVGAILAERPLQAVPHEGRPQSEKQTETEIQPVSGKADAGNLLR